MSRILSALASLAVVTVVLAPAPAAAQEPAPTVELRVMTFNIWYGATVTHGLGEVIEAIRLADADVVGLQEPYARLRRIASALGFHASPRMHVISRFPILEPGGSDGDWALLLLAPGRVAAIMNTHLPATPYTPYRIVNRGFDRATILRQEEWTRLRRIEHEIEALSPLLDAGVPTFFTGDFNSPSHRDWTRAAVLARGLPYPVRWPVARAMEDAGFRDSYREAHPDPVADPGFTWTPGTPAPDVAPWEVHDRIDFVWASGPAETIGSRVVGESVANADVVVTPWPTDHRGVVSTFRVTPATAPVFVAAPERSRPGHALEVTFHAAGADRVELVPADAATPLAVVALGGAADGAVDVPTSGATSGPYDVVLLDASGGELARDRVVLVAVDQRPIVTLADGTVAAGAAIEVSWRFGPGNRYDWLAITRGTASPKETPYLRWRYVDGQVDGATRIAGGSRGPGAWPLRPGRYRVWLCLDDSYRCRASAAFTVAP
ncbi:MAG: endonuclease/exonuclease/phosphatase family protein [Actinomycetota bacterium]